MRLVVITQGFRSSVLNHKFVPALIDEEGNPNYVVGVSDERAQALIDAGVAKEYSQNNEGVINTNDEGTTEEENSDTNEGTDTSVDDGSDDSSDADPDDATNVDDSNPDNEEESEEETKSKASSKKNKK